MIRFRKIISIVLAIAIVTSLIQVTFAAEVGKAEHTELAKGTPVVDGVVDEIWSNSNHNVIGIERGTEKNFYKGWFKLMWDNTNMYVLAKIYSEQFSDTSESPWENDSLEVFVDEKCNRSTTYEEDDYQLRADFNGSISTVNYPEEKMKAAGKTHDNYYILEMAFPFKTISPKAGTTVGFDVQVNASKTAFFERSLYGWSESSRNGAQYIDTSIFGSAELKDTVTVQNFNEPQYKDREVDVKYSETNSLPVNERINDVTVVFDGKATTGVDIIHSDEHPMLEINKFAEMIGAKVKNGNTLVKDKVTIKYTAGNRIANYTHADYPNHAEYMTTYYTNTSDVINGTGSNTVSKIAESLIPGETVSKSLPENYTNPGTDGTNDGYILERAPIKLNGSLYIPLYSIVPTLNYHVEYDRFANPPKIEISTGTNYPAESTYKVYYAKDFGAIGDGVTDDRAAILKGFHAASMSGEPAKFVLEPNKIYKVSERIDRNAFFSLFRIENFIFEGNGSTILFEKPLNTALNVEECKNIKVRNITFMYEEHTSTHGIVEEVNYDEGWFTMRIPETADLPTYTEWMESVGGTYFFGQVYDMTAKHLKFIPWDNYIIDGVDHLGGRLVKVWSAVMKSRKAGIDPGDGFVMRGMCERYDLTTNTKNDTTACIALLRSEDIEFDGTTLCGSLMLGVSVGLCSGKITFRNHKLRAKDGSLLSASSDGLHYWRNRSTLLVENCEFWNNLDDHINTKGERASVREISADRKTCKVDWDQQFRSGDEVVFILRENIDTILGHAYVKEASTVGNDVTLVLDREIPAEVQTGDKYLAYNNMAAGYGSCVRGSKFIQSRRHAYISRSRNTIFMNNYVQNNGGSTVEASNEVTTSEGPFPHAFTIRNNRVYGDGITENTHVLGPIVVRGYNQPFANQTDTKIDGALIQGNIIQVNTGSNSFFMNSVKDLYMSNNKILWNNAWDATAPDGKYDDYVPVYVSNCGVKQFDGFMFDCDKMVDKVAHFVACKVDKTATENGIKLRNGNSSTKAIFEYCN